MADKIHEDYWDAVRDYDMKMYGDMNHAFDRLDDRLNGTANDEGCSDTVDEVADHHLAHGSSSALFADDVDADPRGCVVTPCGKLLATSIATDILDFRDALADIRSIADGRVRLSPYSLLDAALLAIDRIRAVWEDDTVRPLLTHETYACDMCGYIDTKAELVRDITKARFELNDDDENPMPSPVLIRRVCDDLYVLVDGLIVGGAFGLLENGQDGESCVIRLRRYPDGQMGL